MYIHPDAVSFASSNWPATVMTSPGKVKPHVPMSQLFLGLDLGSDKLVTAVSADVNSLSAKLVRNGLGHDTTPTVVAFSRDRCLVGEDARDALRLNPRNAIVDIPRLVGMSQSAYAALEKGTALFETLETSKSTRDLCVGGCGVVFAL